MRKMSAPIIEQNTEYVYFAVPKNIHTSPVEGFLFCMPPSPQEIPVSKILAVKAPLPLAISDDLP